VAIPLQYWHADNASRKPFHYLKARKMIALDIFTPNSPTPYATAYVSRNAPPESIDSIRKGWADLLQTVVTVATREATESELEAALGL